jgi:hypothetical protein
LRAHRADASADFVDDLSARVRGQRAPVARAWSRVVFAAAVSVFVVGTFASFGGLSYAASGATGTYHAVKQIVAKHKLTVRVHSSAAAQYPKSGVSAVKTVHKRAKKPTSVSAATRVGTLPFTGFSLLATFVVSLALIGAGIVLRRRERRE